MADLACCLDEFNLIESPLTYSEYWHDFRCKVAHDKRIRALLDSTCDIDPQSMADVLEDRLIHKQVNYNLTPEEQRLVDIAHCLREFDPIKSPLTCYEYWCNYRSKITKDDHVRTLLNRMRDDTPNTIIKDRHCTAIPV